jgi:hypothetical protein
MSHVKGVYGILPIILFLVAVVHAQVARPLSGHEDFVSLAIFPFEKTNGGSKDIDLRAKVIQALGKSAAMDYLIHSPEGSELDDLYAGAFSRRKDRTYWPVAEYWRKSSTQYVIFGSYSTNRNEIVADVFVYDAKNEKTLLNKKYTAPINESPQLGATISRAIEASLTELPKNKGRVKDNGTKK